VLALLVAAGLLTATPAGAIDDAEELKRVRVRSGAWAGPAWVTGRLGFDAPSATVATSISALPGLALGAEYWPEEQLGVYGGVVVGMGADIDLPDGAGTFRYNTHQLEAGARYRWFFGPRADAGSLIVRLGLRGIRQAPQTLRPALLVESNVLGPEVGVAYDQPLAGGDAWIRVEVHGGVPFFVRESPQDSGDPESQLSVGGGLEAGYHLTADWGLLLRTDSVLRKISFAGRGTRAAGVDGAETDELFVITTLAGRYAF
jgi:hypothetical protein